MTSLQRRRHRRYIDPLAALRSKRWLQSEATLSRHFATIGSTVINSDNKCGRFASQLASASASVLFEKERKKENPASVEKSLLRNGHQSADADGQDGGGPR